MIIITLKLEPTLYRKIPKRSKSKDLPKKDNAKTMKTEVLHHTFMRKISKYSINIDYLTKAI